MVEQQGIVWDGQVEAHASMCCCVVLAVATAPTAEQEDSGLGISPHSERGQLASLERCSGLQRQRIRKKSAGLGAWVGVWKGTGAVEGIP